MYSRWHYSRIIFKWSFYRFSRSWVSLEYFVSVRHITSEFILLSEKYGRSRAVLQSVGSSKVSYFEDLLFSLSSFLPCFPLVWIIASCVFPMKTLVEATRSVIKRTLSVWRWFRRSLGEMSSGESWERKTLPFFLHIFHLFQEMYIWCGNHK